MSKLRKNIVLRDFSPRYRTLFATAYSAGLRTGEVARLTLPDIDRERMRIRVDQGKGGKDRFSILAHATLLLLRKYWKAYRPPRWLFAPERNSERSHRPISPSLLRHKRQIVEALLPNHPAYCTE